ncbi:putative mannan endo-1,6-alpha-mannosidase [Saccharomycopsis crataegensis]|uniref:Mannan endo-1,6-alpha-mannosidase n=1 Tax=Saccharomycopsis crataegensis TaxID=43959 RepID=A0AAV5QKN3_9ASCO|nr:putative mannan endo-1,6-alpha-mannosidase [Saccharomycopsis crataegensis]
MKFLKLFSLLSLSLLASSLDVDITSETSICNALTTVVQGVISYYDGYRPGGVIGEFVYPYYWWEAGEAWGGLVDVVYFCNNDTWESLTYDALLYQKGDNSDYIPSNQSTAEGNDDQGFWGIAAMEAAERNFTNPPSGTAGWLALTQAVVNTMIARWDSADCNGGLRWQIFTWNNGYNYKNTVSNGCLFHLSARLARYTSNDTYVDWATQVWDWLMDVGLISISGSTYSVYDGTTIESSCKTMTEYEWTYNYGLLISGCAYLYSYTGNATWLTHIQGLLTTIESNFFNNSIMYERACESSGTCDNDQKSFKSVFSRFLSQTAILVPDTYDTIRPLIEASAKGAMASCSGTDSSTGRTNACGVKWTQGSYDGNTGLGQQLSAMEILTSLLVTANKPSNDSNSTTSSAVPLSNSTGGTSEGNANAGTDTTKELAQNDLTITTKDKAGAAVLTTAVLGIVCGGGLWMLF